MAIYHMHAQVISRGGGRSVVAAIAYRAAEKVHDERLGQTFDYSRKQGVVHSEIIAPEGAPAWMKDRASLWNGADAAEKRKDAQMAREVRVALPVELSKTEQVEALRGFIKNQFVDRGMVADFSLHHDNPENPHAHILLTTREIAGEGFGKKCRDWNDKALYGQWREEWANHCNLSLQRAGHDIRIDHRSYAEQGIALEPTVNIGKDKSRAERDTNGYVTQERLAEHDRIVRENGQAIIAEPAIALDAITKQRATFMRSDVGRWLHSRTLDVEQFNQALSAVMSHESVVALGVRDDYGNERFTTEGMQRTEREMVDNALELKNSTRHKVDEAFVDQAEVGRGLSDEQRAALRHVLGRRDIAVVEGYAGAGKSRMLGAAREAWEAQGYRVVGAALAGKAAEGLEISAGISSRTIASYERSWAKGYDRLTKNDILVVDEAGMLGTEQMARVVAEVRRAHAKLVLVGDTQQLQAIDAGAPMRAIGNLVGATRLRDIRRQQVDWQRDASVQLAQGDIRRGLNAYHKQGHLHEHQTQREAMAAMVDAWDKARQESPEQTQIMLAFRRQEVADLNALARERRAEAGELGHAEQVQTSDGAKTFAEGDRVYFLRNDRDLEVKNGSLGTIEQFRDGQMVVRLDGEDERRVAFDTRAYDALDHGYAATVHKAQGVTVDRAHVLSSQLFDRNVAYVAMTRHTTQADMHWSQEEFSSTQQAIGVMQRERPKDLALDYDQVAREHDLARREYLARMEAQRQADERAREQARAQAAERIFGATAQARAREPEAPPLATQEERIARQERMGTYRSLEAAQSSARSALERFQPLTMDEAWQSLPEVREAGRQWQQADAELKRARAEEVERRSLPFGGFGRPILHPVYDAQKNFDAAQARWQAVAESPKLDVTADAMVRENEMRGAALRRAAMQADKALAVAQPQQERDVTAIKREEAYLSRERAVHEKHVTVYRKLEQAHVAAQAGARREPVTLQAVWLRQPEVQSATASREHAYREQERLAAIGEGFKKEHPWRAALGQEPRVWFERREMSLNEGLHLARERVVAAERHIKALERSPELRERAEEIVRDHNGRIEAAQNEIPRLAKAMREAQPYAEQSQKVLRELKVHERAMAREISGRDLTREHDRGMGLGR